MAYIAEFYGHRLWAGPGGFDPGSTAFHAAPFADAGVFRSSIAAYEPAMRAKPSSEPASFPDRCAVAFPNCVGPFTVPGAGHFLQWERSDLFNRTLTRFLA